jgi:hypothetical protein
MSSFSFRHMKPHDYHIFVGVPLRMADDRNRAIPNEKEGTRPSPTTRYGFRSLSLSERYETRRASGESQRWLRRRVVQRRRMPK